MKAMLMVLRLSEFIQEKCQRMRVLSNFFICISLLFIQFLPIISLTIYTATNVSM